MNSPYSLRLSYCTVLLTALLSSASSHGADTRSERLWLPASAAHLRPFLQMAVDLALEDENCTDVLYARMNEYRTIYDEPTFTILCKKDAKSTFNRVIPITEVDPDYFAKIQQSEDALDTARTLSPEIEALRNQLLTPSSAAGASTQESAPSRSANAAVAPAGTPASAPTSEPAAPVAEPDPAAPAQAADH